MMRMLHFILNTCKIYSQWMFIVGLSFVFFAFIAEEGEYQNSLLILGGILFLVDLILGLGWIRFQKEPSIPKRAKTSILIVYGLVALSFALFLLRSSIDTPIDPVTGEIAVLQDRVRLFLLFLVTIIVIVSIFYRLGLSLSQQYRRFLSDQIQFYRQNYLLKSGILTFALILFFAVINYFSVLRNPSIDLTPGYLSFSANSEKILVSVDRELSIYAFLPERQTISQKPDSIARPELFDIAGDLQLLLEQMPILNSKIKLRVSNADFTGTDASLFKGVSNGVIILRSYKKEQNDSGGEKPFVERRLYVFNKNDLAGFEQDIVKAVLFVSTPTKRVYFTALNGEKESLRSNQNAAAGIRELKKRLATYNAIASTLDRKSVWPLQVPDDADALFILGPTRPLSEQARRALIEYLRYGGKVFITIDPEGREDFSWLLGLFGNEPIFYEKDIVVNSKLRGLLVTNEFINHPITNNLYAEDDFLIFGKSGFFTPANQKIEELAEIKTRRDILRLKQIFETGETNTAAGKPENLSKKVVIKDPASFVPKKVIFSTYDSFIDANSNNKRDSEEPEAKRALMLTYETISNPETESSESSVETEVKAEKTDDQTTSPKLVISSSTVWLNDWSLRYPLDHRNFTLAVDVYFWLIENPLLAGIATQQIQEEEVILDEKNKWKILVFGVILFPMLLSLVLAGVIAIYRRSKNYQTTHVLDK